MDEKDYKKIEHLEAHVEAVTKNAGGVLRSRFGIWGLATLSFVESALVVPIITDPFLAAYILADRSQYIKAVVVTTIASVAGGTLAYGAALLFFDVLSQSILTQNLLGEMDVLVEAVTEGVFLLTLLGAVTPIPYTLVAFAVGFVDGHLGWFLLASVIGRGGRYYIVGLLTYYFGPIALEIARKQIRLISILLILMVIFYFVSRFVIGVG